MVKLFQKRQKQKPVNKFSTKIEKYFNIYTFLIKIIKYLFSKTIFFDFLITISLTHSDITSNFTCFFNKKQRYSFNDIKH